MRKFIGKHRKLLSIFGVILAAVIITVTTIGVVNNVTAGVFKGENDKNKEKKGVGNEVKILEIVPEYGQQILGYTIPGYEPITKEAIEAYPVDGEADLESAEFTNATGWSVTKTNSGYVVNENKLKLKDSFSKNVFGDALNSGENSDVNVVVKQANDVTSSDILQCDLIYINNPKENDSNLLYYYDQVMNYDADTQTFSHKYAKGDIGAYYDSVNYESVASSELAVRLIKNATGKVSASTLNDVLAKYYEKIGTPNTKSIFEVAGLSNYREYNEQDYLIALENAQKGSLSDKEAINEFLKQQNSAIENSAINEIKNSAGSAAFKSNMNDSKNREAFRQTMIKANLIDSATGLSLFINENFDLYVTQIENTAQGGFSLGRSSINTAIKYINSNASNEARNLIVSMSQKSVDEIKAGATKEVFAKANLDVYKDYNYDAYVNALSANKVETQTEVLNMVEKVNDEQKLTNRLSIGEAAGNAESTAKLTDDIFVGAELDNYDTDLIDFYKKAIEESAEGSLVIVESVKNEYNDSPDDSIIVHIKTNEEITAVPQLSASIRIDGEDTPVEIEAVDMILEDGSNNYYRAVLKIADDVLADLQGKESVLSLHIAINGQDAKSFETESLFGEYWCVFNTDVPDGRLFDSNEEVVADEEFGDEYKYGDFTRKIADIDKINELISKVTEDNSKLDAEISYDFSSWDVAKALYEYSNEAESGLIYSSYIVSNIGKYDNNDYQVSNTNDSTAVRSNNVYKALLIISLSSRNSFNANMLNKIDDEGAYCPSATNSSNKIDNWNITTFGNNTNAFSTYFLYKSTLAYGRKLCFNGSEFQKENFAKNCSGIYTYNELKNIKDATEPGPTLGDIIRTVMNMYINQLQSYPLKVLEIEPVSLSGKLGAAKNVNDENLSYNGAVQLAKWLRIDYSDMNRQNYKDYFQVTSMSVREFNTQNKDLTSEYDLIYFGSNSSTMRSQQYNINNQTLYRTTFNDSSLNGYVYTSVGDKFTVNSFIRGSLASDYERVTTKITNRNNNAGRITYNSQTDYNIWKKYFTDAYDFDFNSGYFYTVKNSNCIARGAANDITVKKYDELMEYLKAGYPILMDDEIINCDTDKYIVYDGNYNNCKKWRYVDPYSKLYHFIQDAKKLGYDSTKREYTGKDNKGEDVFADGYKYANLVNTSYARYGSDPEKLTVENKFNGGLSFATKRNEQINFEYISGPTEYDSKVTNGIGVTIQYGTTEYSRYRIVLQAPESTDMQWLEENYEFVMYIDKSGLGKFSEDNTVDMEPDVDFNYKIHRVVIEGNWPMGEDGTMDGFLPWRVEAYNKSNPNNHYIYTGYSAFQKVDKNGNPTKKDVEVLWVQCGNNLAFNNVVNTDIPEYKINLTTVSYYDFANNTKYWPKDDKETVYDASNSRLKVGIFNNQVNSSDERYNKEFDMVVFGYCDSYTGLDINNINALRNIDYFVSSGHSLFFAHDNSGYTMSVNSYNSNWDMLSRGSDLWAKYTTAYMRGMLGFDLYGVTYSPKAFIYGYDKYGNPVSEDEADEDTTLNPLYNKAVADARKYMNDSDEEVFRGMCEGTVFRQSGRTQFLSNNGTGGNIGTGLPTTTTVRFANKGQVSVYPYVLGDNTIQVANTHFQYEALNLEDEDTVVWATLDSNNINSLYGTTSGDGSNGYYIYTKGNITYTGAGHSYISGQDETRLFLNTVIAAIKAGNYGPEIVYTNKDDTNTQDESVIYSYDTDKYVSVNFKISDIDRKKGVKGAFSDVKIYFDKIDESENGKTQYDSSKDILINSTSDYMMDESGETYVTYNKDNILNRIECKFTLAYVDIANKYNELHGISDRYELRDGAYYKNGSQGSYSSEIKDITEQFFKEYKIAITATDIPKAVTGTNSKSVGITRTSVARISFRTLFNLN